MLDFDDFEVLTFDCYGTLIDWEAGILAALRPTLRRHRVELGDEPLLELYGALESEIEGGEYRAYRAVLAEVLVRLGKRLGFAPSAAECEAFSLSVRDWPAFADSPRALQALQRKYKLAILSNVDDDLFAHSAARLQVDFDYVITAQQLRSYKPSLNNFRRALERLSRPKEKILHVAQSLFHDIAPAKSIGLATVWVNRRHDRPGAGATPPASARPDLEVPDLQTLARRIGLL